ncbi:hypothetical protein P7K49_038828 [Saguinus oedipus]|uniref:Uncharacterized protein n=1 Tax=Saguinus oedipus TaxID=9490 RepID=A0ABQ9TFS1_SAGOE|nr:hypothetical protein P7K49_038828 [Saguinus oedipus]
MRAGGVRFFEFPRRYSVVRGLCGYTSSVSVMSSQKRSKNVQAQNRTSQGSNSFQTTLSAWKVKQDPSNSKSISKHGEDNPVGDYEHADDQAEDALQMAVGYFEKGPIKTSRNKDKTLEKHLKTVENVAWKNGLASEEIDILLNVALSGKFE